MKQLTLTFALMAIIALPSAGFAAIATDIAPTPTPGTLASAQSTYSVNSNNQITNAQGQVVATYNPTNGQFMDGSGKLISSNTDQYGIYKSVLAQTQAQQATMPAAGTPGVYGQTYAIDPKGIITDPKGTVIGFYNPDTNKLTDAAGQPVTDPSKAQLFGTLASTLPKTQPQTAATVTTDPELAGFKLPPVGQLKDLGDGASIDSEGNIFRDGAKIAKLADNGQLTALANNNVNKLKNDAQIALTNELRNKLGSVMGLFSSKTVSSSTFKQENTYTASSDEDTYYGTNNKDLSSGYTIKN